MQKLEKNRMQHGTYIEKKFPSQFHVGIPVQEKISFQLKFLNRGFSGGVSLTRSYPAHDRAP